MTPKEQEDAKVRHDLQAIANSVDHQLPYGWAFVVLASPFGADARMNYISNANRADVVRMMYEFIEATKGKWAEHVPEQDSAAEDEQLGRARQRVAELEGILRQTKEVIEDLSDHGSAAERMELLKEMRAEVERLKAQDQEIRAELERLKAQHEEMLLKHAREQGVALSALETALKEIERLKANRTT